MVATSPLALRSEICCTLEASPGIRSLATGAPGGLRIPLAEPRARGTIYHNQIDKSTAASLAHRPPHSLRAEPTQERPRCLSGWTHGCDVFCLQPVRKVYINKTIVQVASLTGIEPAGRLFSSVQLGLSSCVFGSSVRH